MCVAVFSFSRWSSVVRSWVLGFRSRPDAGSRSCVLHAYSNRCGQGFAYRSGRLRHSNPTAFECLDLLRGGSLPAGNDGAGMAHTASRRSGLPRDEAHNRLLHVLLHELGSEFFGVTADFTDHDDSFCFRIAVEEIESVDKIGADDGIAADADGGRLPNAALRKLMHRLVGQRPRARHNANRSFFVDRCRHDADLAFTWRDDARAVRADQARAAVLEELPRLYHVEGRNAFGDTDDQVDLRVGSFHDGVGRKWRWNEDHGRVGSGLVDGFAHGVENRPAFMSRPTLAGRYPADDLSPIGGAGFRMKCSLAAGQALYDHSRIFID